MPRATKGSLEDVGSAHSVPESTPVPDATTEIERLASCFISKFLEGINSLASMPKSLAHLQVQYTQEYHIEELVYKAVKVKKEARSCSWCYLFLAGTISSSSGSLPARTNHETCEDVSQARRTAARWAGMAEVVNAVVKILYHNDNWNFKAYLVYNALAGRSRPFDFE